MYPAVFPGALWIGGDAVAVKPCLPPGRGWDRSPGSRSACLRPRSGGKWVSGSLPGRPRPPRLLGMSRLAAWVGVALVSGPWPGRLWDAEPAAAPLRPHSCGGGGAGGHLNLVPTRGLALLRGLGLAPEQGRGRLLEVGEERAPPASRRPELRAAGAGRDRGCGVGLGKLAVRGHWCQPAAPVLRSEAELCPRESPSVPLVPSEQHQCRPLCPRCPFSPHHPLGGGWRPPVVDGDDCGFPPPQGRAPGRLFPLR